MSTQTSHSPIISWRRALLDGTVMNSTLSVLIYSSLAINAEMWLQDYPPDIKAAFGPKSKKAQIQSMILTIPFFGILLGGVIWSNRKLRERKWRGAHLQSRVLAHLCAIRLFLAV
ncbi:MAG: hypothetical protein R3E31_26800 [Chloroflexota bacterium]